MYSSKFLKSIKLKILNLKNFKIENFKKSQRKVRMSKIMRTPIKLGLRTCATCAGCGVLNHGVGVSPVFYRKLEKSVRLVSCYGLSFLDQMQVQENIGKKKTAKLFKYRVNVFLETFIQRNKFLVSLLQMACWTLLHFWVGPGQALVRVLIV